MKTFALAALLLLFAATLPAAASSPLRIVGGVLIPDSIILPAGLVYTGVSVAVTGGVTGASLTITNTAAIGQLTVTNGITGGTLAITNGITAASGTITNTWSAGALTATNAVTAGSAAITNGITAGSATVTNVSTAGILGYANVLATGGTTVINNSRAAFVTNLTDTALTSGRVVVAGASGLLGDSSGLTFTAPDLGVTGSAAVGYELNCTNGSSRNWATAANINAFGDFAIMQSNAQGGNPVTAGTPKIYISSAGRTMINTATDDGNGALQVNGYITIPNAAVLTAPGTGTVTLTNAPGSAVGATARAYWTMIIGGVTYYVPLL